MAPGHPPELVFPEFRSSLDNAVLESDRQRQASNLPFEDKKRRYVQRSRVAPFALTVQIVREPSWTIDVVRARQRQLMETLKGMWDL